MANNKPAVTITIADESKQKKKKSSTAADDDDPEEEEQQTVVVNEFIPGIAPPIKLFNTITIYGKRGSGKSVCIKWLLQFFKNEIPWFFVFTLTQLNSFYESWIAQRFIIPEFNDAKLRSVMLRQTKARELAEHNPAINPRACVIWDDYNGNDIRYNAELANYYYTGRHYMALNIFAAQHITLTPPAIRSNTVIVILFNTDYADSIDHYWRDFAGKLEKKVFYDMFNQVTGDDNCFLCINTDPKCPYNKKFFKGKAVLLDEGPDWIVGCREMWIKNQEQLDQIYAGTYIERFKLAQELAEHNEQYTHDMLEVMKHVVPYEPHPQPASDGEKGDGFMFADVPPLSTLDMAGKSSKDKVKKPTPKVQVPVPHDLLKVTPFRDD